MTTLQRKHIRLRNYDYSSEGYYFITICTKDRICFFGNIENRILIPSVIGKQAQIFWNEIPEHFGNVRLGKYVIMPNHVHGIIEISGKGSTDTADRTGHGLSLRLSKQNEFGKTIPSSISAIIGQYKSTITRWCNKNKYAFGWQIKFYDHVVRNETELNRIENYIINNVNNWEGDKFFSGVGTGHGLSKSDTRRHKHIVFSHTRPIHICEKSRKFVA